MGVSIAGLQRRILTWTGTERADDIASTMAYQIPVEGWRGGRGHPHPLIPREANLACQEGILRNGFAGLDLEGIRG